jgi:hypothetical protein
MTIDENLVALRHAGFAAPRCVSNHHDMALFEARI